MLRLLRNDDIPSYSVHDSLLVKAKDASMVSYVLKEEYQRLVGIRPHLKIKAHEKVWAAFHRLKFATAEI